MDHAKGTTGYKELEPFVKTIRMQHENILRVAKVRQEFTANVSHELKTPLTVISGYAELIESGMVAGDAVKQYAREIHHNSNRLLSLINDIIHLSEMRNYWKSFFGIYVTMPFDIIRKKVLLRCRLKRTDTTSV